MVLGHNLLALLLVFPGLRGVIVRRIQVAHPGEAGTRTTTARIGGSRRHLPGCARDRRLRRAWQRVRSALRRPGPSPVRSGSASPEPNCVLRKWIGVGLRVWARGLLRRSGIGLAGGRLALARAGLASIALRMRTELRRRCPKAAHDQRDCQRPTSIPTL